VYPVSIMRLNVFTKKEGLALISIFLATIVLSRFIRDGNDTGIASYYKIIANQEQLRDDVLVAKSDLAVLYACSNKKVRSTSQIEECMRDFYDAYTVKNGAEMAFAHLARLQKEHPDLLAGCHYISHGIGNATLRLNGKDPYKAFDLLQNNAFFKNVVTCGNGYFHGVIEEVAKDVHGNDELAQVLGGICQSDRIENKGNCFHGIGHATMIQTKYSIPDMIYVCDRTSAKPRDLFGCHTGGFMEYAQLYQNVAKVKDGKIEMTLCDSLEQKYQPACYMEQSSLMEGYSEDRRDYVRNIGFCKQFPNELNRMACVKLFAIRAVRLVRYERVYEMCKNTTTRHEQVMCTAVMADRIGGSLDKTRKTEEYKRAVVATCGTLNPLHALYCRDLVSAGGGRLFYTSAKDLHFPSLYTLLTRREPATLRGPTCRFKK
jgi:hypothetical protein